MKDETASGVEGARFWRRALPLIALAMAMPLLPRGIAGSAPDAKTHVIEMRAFQFAPAVTRAAVGDTVVWQNTDAVVHNATGDGWRSGDVAAKANATLVVTKRGQLEYTCTYHPSMKGRLEVR